MAGHDRGLKLARWGVLPVLVLIIVLIAFFGGTNACRLARSLESSRAEYTSWCVEFWLNRYQALIAGLLALAGGLLTVYFVRLQIEEMRHQAQREKRRLAEGRVGSFQRINDRCLVIGRLLNKSRTQRLRAAMGPVNPGLWPPERLAELDREQASVVRAQEDLRRAIEAVQNDAAALLDAPLNGAIRSLAFSIDYMSRDLEEITEFLGYFRDGDIEHKASLWLSWQQRPPVPDLWEIASKNLEDLIKISGRRMYEIPELGDWSR